MSDHFESLFGAMDGPRPLDPAFQEGLERAMAETASGRSSVPWSIDRPRQLPHGAFERILAVLLRRRRRLLASPKLVAAVAAVSLVAATTYVVTDRLGSRRSGDRGPIVAAPTTTPSVSPSPSPAPTKHAEPNGPSTLRGFASSAQFLAYVRTEGLRQNTGFGIPGSVEQGRGGFSPSPGSPPAAMPLPSSPSTAPYSQTNVQEAGVDEPDIVKTDGRHMVVVTGGVLRVYDVRQGPRLTDSMDLDARMDDRAFLVGDTVVVLGTRFQAPKAAAQITHVESRVWTSVRAFSIADPAKIRQVSSMDVEGELVDARLVAGIVRMVVRSPALGPEPADQGNYIEKDMKKAEAANARAIRASTVGDWVPHFVTKRPGAAATTGHLYDWSAISRPPGRPGLAMLSLITFDPDDPRPDNAVAVIGAGDFLYASTTNVYVTSTEVDEEPSLVTRIHKFDIADPARARYVASGEVRGRLLNQFAMSEYAGRLRVAATRSRFGQEPESSSSSVTVLSDRQGRLVVAGSVGNLGKGERIYSVRFVGPTAYVVTFRELDPLYVVDLRKPNRPRVRGLLKIPGYSEYLHPISTASLLGVGRDASKTGQAKGLQVSLFDVSDPTDPRRVDVMLQGAYGYSGLEHDHHAFLYWAPEKLVVIPAVLSSSGETVSFVGALAFTVDDDGIGTPTRISHEGRSGTGKGEPPSILRSVVVGQRLLTISTEGVLVSDLETLDDRAWAPFPN
ncbi:MAG TPA: beta-propeller domain-containing protein [Actinomycetota bacterium]|nr:beta-propeller domain-containing protein [Actinomycetota bacterium]